MPNPFSNIRLLFGLVLFLATSVILAAADAPSRLLPNDEGSTDWLGQGRAAADKMVKELDWVEPRFDPDALLLGEKLKANHINQGIDSIQHVSDTLQALGIEAPATATSGKPALPHSPIPGRESVDPIYVFISLSLPEDYLRSLFEFGAKRKDVRFVLRGWIPPRIGDLQYAIGQLIKDVKHPPRIDIDPSIFKRYDIEQVPVFLQDRHGTLRQLHGEISLDGAVNWITDTRPMPEDPVGPLHDIEEPNILDELDKRLAKFDWKSEIAKARENALLQVQGYPLPRTTRDRVYWVDISTTFREDVTLPDGRIVVKAGTRVNPLDVVALRQRYVFFDPTDSSQIEVVKQWQKEHTNLKLIATELSPLSDAASLLIREMGQMVFPANRLLVERFQIKSVPALVEQDDGLLKITVVKPHWGENSDSLPLSPKDSDNHAVSKKEDT